MPKGAKIAANIPGKVVAAGTYGKGTGLSGYGNVVVVQDSKGQFHLYAHMDSVGVKVGQTVGIGSNLGAAGSTGQSTGSHLHYEVRNNPNHANGYGSNIDPTPYLQGIGTTASGSKSSSSSSSGGKVSNKSYNSAPKIVQPMIQKASSQYKVHPSLISAVMKAESNYNPKAQSHAGAYGLMQLMPLWGEGRMDPQQNVNIGTKFLRDNLKKYGNLPLALAAYNWGPGALDKAIKKAGTSDWNKIKQYAPKETQNYVTKVIGYL